MADGYHPSLLEPLYPEAVGLVAGWLDEIGAARLPAEIVESYPFPGCIGWRIPTDVGDRVLVLDALLGPNFPYSQPAMFLVDAPPFPAYPHLNPDASICVLPANAEWDTSQPLAFFKAQIASAADVLTKGVTGENHDDFREELLSYWRVDSGRLRIRSLLRPEPGNRTVGLWRGSDFAIVADDHPTINEWLAHRNGEKTTKKWNIGSAFLIWLDQAPLPTEFPDNVEALMDVLERESCLGDFARIIAQHPEAATVIFGFPAEHSTAFIAVDVMPSRSGRRRGTINVRHWLRDGFRDAVPAQIVLARFLNNASVARRFVDRIDPAWIHGRDANPDLDHLQTSTVTLVGCGSLGSEVARLLAQAGVAGFCLIDPETLQASNTARHVLGSAAIGASKAKALARKLEQDFPHIVDVKVSDHRAGWMSVRQQEPRAILGSDLVISTVGSWHVEANLNRWLSETEGSPAAVYGWAEPHSMAGHAILVRRGGACLQCGIRPNGQTPWKVTTWDRPTIHREPACGAFFQPYGSVNSLGVARMIADLALDALLNRAQPGVHRSWSAPRRSLDLAGGAWTPEWLALVDGDERGGREIEGEWVANEHCEVCR